MAILGRQRTRNRRAPIQRRFGTDRRSRYIVHYEDATVSRTSEGAYQDPRDNWRFQGTTESDNWKGQNIPRIFSDGAILVETKASTNQTRLSEWVGGSSVWLSSSNDVTASVTQQAAPDGGLDANLIVLGSGSTTDHWRTYVGANDVTNNLTSSFTYWLKHTGSTGDADTVRFGSRDKGLGESDYVDTAFDGTWNRITKAIPNGSGSNTLLIYATMQTDPAVPRGVYGWGFQLEADQDYPTSYIRTGGSVATRARDNVLINAGKFDGQAMSQGFEFDFYPLFDSNSKSVGSSIILYQYDGTNQGLIRWLNGTTIKVNLTNPPQEITFSGLVYSKYQKLTFRVDSVNLTVTLSGFTSGTGFVSGSRSFAMDGPWGSSGNLYFAQDNFGNPGEPGVFSRIRRLY